MIAGSQHGDLTDIAEMTKRTPLHTSLKKRIQHAFARRHRAPQSPVCQYGHASKRQFECLYNLPG
ncbi:hypothetical protein [Uliginosibacterium flavum]|uniref:Uncharacterized protein n=1 Tax=Uliginosibacterium flavum TaxID=1396831 RepID=A0ABV2TMU7_9RHOO